ncbi:MAG TPA: AI-2E family transporter [Pirellulales bacterium]|jgi:predicted PurR-regulated permease PerM|nr:AI-2E family transporter [Pirellulales bacterium]
MARIVSFVMLVAILLVMGALFFEVMAGFFVPLFLAVLLVVMFRPLHRWFVGRCRGRERLAAGLTTLSILSIVMAPLLFVLIQAGFEASAIAEHWNTQTVKERLAALRDRTGLSLPPQAILDWLDEVDDALADWPKPNEPPNRSGLTELATALNGFVTALTDELRSSQQAPAWAATRDKAVLDADLDSLAGTAPKLNEAIAREEAAGDSLVEQVQFRLDALRADLLGSSWKRWLKKQVNPSDEQLAAWRTRARGFADSLAVGGAQFAGDVLPDLVIGLAVMVVALYYFLADGPAMIKALMRISPLDDRYEEQLLNEFSTVTRAVVVATLLSALVQGLLAGVGYLFAGLGSVALLTMLTMLFSLVPFVGGTAVWVPCCLWLFLEGRITAAIVLALYCGIVVSASDNIIKPLVLQGQSNLHPLLALLSVLGGVKALGPIGILVGPMIVAFLQALLKMVQIELEHLSKPSETALDSTLSPKGASVISPGQRPG